MLACLELVEKLKAGLSQDLALSGSCQIYFAGLIEDAINRDLLHTHIVGTRALAIIVSVDAGAARQLLPNRDRSGGPGAKERRRFWTKQR